MDCVYSAFLWLGLHFCLFTTLTDTFPCYLTKLQGVQEPERLLCYHYGTKQPSCVQIESDLGGGYLAVATLFLSYLQVNFRWHLLSQKLPSKFKRFYGEFENLMVSWSNTFCTSKRLHRWVVCPAFLAPSGSEASSSGCSVMDLFNTGTADLRTVWLFPQDPSRNHRAYRLTVAKLEPPIIPFMPLLIDQRSESLFWWPFIFNGTEFVYNVVEYLLQQL